MRLHIFNDPHGFNLNMTVERFRRDGILQENVFWNLNDETVFRNDAVKYLKKDLGVYKKALSSVHEIKDIVFYPLDFVAAAFLELLLKKHSPSRIGWVFWSYELYHAPAILHKHYDEFSAPFAPKKGLIVQSKKVLSDSAKKLLRIPVYDHWKLEEARNRVTHFYSFLEEDFHNAYPGKVRPRWSRIAFYSIENIAAGLENSRLTNEIMIGHAATPPSNHETIFRRLSSLQKTHTFFIPLGYGDDGYRQHIRKVAPQYLGEQAISFLEERLDTNAYFARLSRLGFAIFNFSYQEGLGNLVFLIWNGAKVFLNEESTPYKEFKKWGLTVFSVSSDLSDEALRELLPEADRINNRKIMEDYVGEETVAKYWRNLTG